MKLAERMNPGDSLYTLVLLTAIHGSCHYCMDSFYFLLLFCVQKEYEKIRHIKYGLV